MIQWSSIITSVDMNMGNIRDKTHNIHISANTVGTSTNTNTNTKSSNININIKPSTVCGNAFKRLKCRGRGSDTDTTIPNITSNSFIPSIISIIPIEIIHRISNPSIKQKSIINNYINPLLQMCHISIPINEEYIQSICIPIPTSTSVSIPMSIPF